MRSWIEQAMWAGILRPLGSPIDPRSLPPEPRSSLTGTILDADEESDRVASEALTIGRGIDGAVRTCRGNRKPDQLVSSHLVRPTEVIR